jgi:hypothetical protein
MEHLAAGLTSGQRRTLAAALTRSEGTGGALLRPGVVQESGEFVYELLHGLAGARQRPVQQAYPTNEQRAAAIASLASGEGPRGSAAHNASFDDLVRSSGGIQPSAAAAAAAAGGSSSGSEALVQTSESAADVGAEASKVS